MSSLSVSGVEQSQSSSITTREFRCEKKDNYKFKNVSLFTILKVIRPKHSEILLCINGIELNVSLQKKNYNGMYNV